MNIEERLIRLCIQGDRKAQLQLYDRCYSYLMSICIRYCRDSQEAGSRLNLAFLKILQHLDQFDQKGSFKAWISKITLRSIIDEFRSQQKHYQHHVYHGEMTDEFSNPSATLNAIVKEVDLDYIMSMVNRLPPMEKQVFNMFVIDGFSHKEIGATLFITESTSKWYVHEAKKKLRDYLVRESKKASLK